MSTHSTGDQCPWWNDRKKQLSRWMTFSVDPCPNNQPHLSWINKELTQPNNIPSIGIIYGKGIEPVPEKQKQQDFVSNSRSKKEIDDDDVVLRTAKVTLQLTQEQKKIVQRIFGTGRYAYNCAVKLATWRQKQKMKQMKWQDMVQFLLSEEQCKSNYPSWFNDKKNCPRSVKTDAIHELCAAITSTKASLKAKGKDPNSFELKFRRKKDRCQNFQIQPMHGPSVQFTSDGGFSFWPTMQLGTLKPARKQDFDRIQRLSNNTNGSTYRAVMKYETVGHKYSLIFIYERKKQTKEPLEQAPLTIALDPGIRTFQAGYDTKGRFVSYGTGDIQKVFLHGLFADHLQSKIDLHYKDHYEDTKERIRYKNQRYRWRKRIGLIQNKIHNWMKTAHWNIARELCQTYDHILISRFKVQGMIKKYQRKINCENVRKMLQWSHYLFRQRLKSKAEEWGCQVHEVSEHYTSMNCGWCGKLNRKLGKSKHFKCPYCGFELDRDWNGARNIFLMNIEQTVGKVIHLSSLVVVGDEGVGTRPNTNCQKC